MAYSSISKLLSRPRLRLVVGYAVAVVSIEVAFVAAFLYFHRPLAIMSFSFCAIAITFCCGGIGPGGDDGKNPV